MSSHGASVVDSVVDSVVVPVVVLFLLSMISFRFIESQFCVRSYYFVVSLLNICFLIGIMTYHWRFSFL